MKIIFYVLVVGLSTILFLVSSFSITNFEKISNQEDKINPPFLNCNQSWADSVLKTLSLDEKIAQLLMVAAYSNKGNNHKQYITSLIKRYKIGGLIFFQGGPVRQAQLCNYYQSISDTPLLIAMDAEWGLSMRLDSTIKYPRQLMLGAIKDNSLIYQMGFDIAEQLKRIGVQVNFAPVVDINNNPNNPVINSRSFGEDKENVFLKGLSYSLGMQDNGILAVLKHFPGHGDTDTDSHYALPVVNQSIKRLDSLEFYPFKKLIDKGVGGVMVAHLNVPALDNTRNLASTLSKPIVSGWLKDCLGFKGLIFTDALNMKGVSNYFKSGEIEAKALVAGNDILLMPSDVPRAIASIKREIKKGNITEQTINERCRKVLSAKNWLGLSEYKPVNLLNLYNDLHKEKYYYLKRQLIESSTSLLKNENDLIPLKKLDTLNIASFSIGKDYKNNFQNTLDYYTNITHFTINKNAEIEEFYNFFDSLSSYNLVIVSVDNINMYASRNFGISNNTIKFVDSLVETKKVILDVFANPYAIAFFNNTKKLSGLIMSYQDDSISESYSAQMIFGGIPILGILPVSASAQFPQGKSIVSDHQIRLKYTIPEEVNMNRVILRQIDSIALMSIEYEATPGCQILIAKDEKVIYQKSFGYHTYLNKFPVKNTDIYDLASITKIVSTVASLMKLTDEEKFDINNKLSYYAPYLKKTNKKKIEIKDILTHQARLQAWIPFYKNTLLSKKNGGVSYRTSYYPDYPYKQINDKSKNGNMWFNPKIYSNTFSEEYPIKIANSLYINKSYRDTIYDIIYKSKLREKHEYKYSDLGFYLFADIIEDIVNAPLEDYTQNSFYKPLGATTLGYLPLQKFSLNEIIPTENDLSFRKQLIHGYVQDQGCAMLGGVGGHAGVFSSANDLAKMMQMYLNNGIYGGERFIHEETIKEFTACQFCDEGKKKHNRRGLGFDKPEFDKKKISPTCDEAPRSSFGHSGFTGTYAWDDPDNQLVYIFLSNRVHPDADNDKLIKLNIRTEIQKVIYEALGN